MVFQRGHEFSSGKKNPFFGKAHSTKSRKKMSEAHKGKKLSKESIEKRTLKQSGLIRSKETRIKISNSKKGNKNPQWKGGCLFDTRSRILILTPRHPNSNKGGYVFEHRLVAEKALGRYLKSNEVVHHVNGDTQDNRNANLLICEAGYHHWLHGKMSQLYQKEHFSRGGKNE